MHETSKKAAETVVELLEEITESKEQCDLEEFLATGLSLDDWLSLKRLILVRAALRQRNKQVTAAASLLKTNRQKLSRLINVRYPQLMGERTPLKSRKKSIIKIK